MVDLEGVTLLANGLLCALMAGAMGGVANFLIAPLFGAMHLTTVCGVDIAPHLDKLDLYSKVFWGGVWGLVFLEPFLKRCVRSVWLRALVYGPAVAGADVPRLPSGDAVRYRRRGPGRSDARVCAGLQHAGLESSRMRLVRADRDGRRRRRRLLVRGHVDESPARLT